MTEFQVIELMESSKTEAEWNKNCDTVKNSLTDTLVFGFKQL
jgi:hypothetical protein